MYLSIQHIIPLTLIFILGGGFLVFYVTLYNRRKRKHLEEKTFLRQQFQEELAKTQMEVQEQTLKTIATEIHDNVGQLLSLSKLTLSTVNIANEPKKAQMKVENTLSLLDTSIKELRQLASLLYAYNLLSAGLDGAVQNELYRLERTERYEINWLCAGDAARELNPQHALIAFRIFQELINNIVKHAEATRIDAKFEYLSFEVQIEIADNGQGFNLKKVAANPTGLGITTLFKRATMMGGSFELTSEIGVGTIAKLTIPY